MIDRNTKCDQKGTKVEGRHESVVCSGEEGKPIAIAAGKGMSCQM